MDGRYDSKSGNDNDAYKEDGPAQGQARGRAKGG